MAQNRRICIVDDEELVRRALERELRFWVRDKGMDISSYATPTAALDSIRASPESVLVVLSDQRMPYFEGLDMIDLIRQVDPDIPSILISGHFDASQLVDGRVPGLFAVLSKPWSHEDLVRSVSSAVASRLEQARQIRFAPVAGNG